MNYSLSSSSSSSSPSRSLCILPKPQRSLKSLSTMDPRTASTLCLFFILSIHSKVISGESSVVFLDSPSGNFLRHSSAQPDAFSPAEVGAAASVLLGLAPSSMLTASSSSKLNEVLSPNPFNRPQAVLLLEVSGVEGSEIVRDSVKSAIDKSISIKVVNNDIKADIKLSDEDDVSLVSLDEASSNAEYTDKELNDFASWFGGSYVEDVSGPLRGELVLPMANGASLSLHMSETADREFTKGLLLLINNIRRAMEMHGSLEEKEHSPAELITGRFSGIKALLDHYGKEGKAQSGYEVFLTSISKIFDSLQTAYKGKIVGLLVHDGSRATESGSMLQVTFTSRSSARSLAEAEASIDPRIIEVLFVRTVLAWITGIILLIATILGIHFLMNMSLTKDTLLYSNVKLD